MDWPTIAVDGGALAVLVGWNVVDHVRVSRLKDEQIATLKAHLAQVAELTYKGANDQIEALDQLHKRELEVLRRQHAAELDLARIEEEELRDERLLRREFASTPERLREAVEAAEGELAELEQERQRTRNFEWLDHFRGAMPQIVRAQRRPGP